jgi:hypothetical protein
MNEQRQPFTSMRLGKSPIESAGGGFLRLGKSGLKDSVLQFF